LTSAGRSADMPLAGVTAPGYNCASDRWMKKSSSVLSPAGNSVSFSESSGVIDSSVAGLILGTAYTLRGRSLWASISAHGFIDTFRIIDAFFGWST